MRGYRAIVGRQRDQDRLLDPARTAHAEFCAELNVAPTDPLPVVRYDAKERQRSLDIMRWGLIPYWAKDIKIGYSTFNARAEEIDTKPAFCGAFRQRRYLVPRLSRVLEVRLSGPCLCGASDFPQAHTTEK